MNKRSQSMPHTLRIRVYYEDTDMAGIVYYANYLRFIERARSEYLRSAGIDQIALKEDHGLVFAVRRVEADFLSPARFDDLLEVETSPVEVSGAKAVLLQHVTRDGMLLFRAIVTIAAIGPSGRPLRLPADVRQALAGTAP